MITELFNSIGISFFTFMHWMLAVSITLFVIDIFFQTEFISWISLFLSALYLTVFLDVHFDLPIQWILLSFIVFLFLAFLFYYGVWSRLVNPIIKKSLLKKATPEQHERAMNEIAVFRIIEDNYFVEWNGELWNASSNEDILTFSEKEKVRVVKSELGTFLVSKIK